MRLFLEVYECNSVSRAAERLGLTQSTVSHGLERLRRALGDALFVRDGRNIVPTAQADFLAPRIRNALAALETLSAPQEFNPSREVRPVTIACNSHELNDEMTAIYRRLQSEAPDLPVRFLPLGSYANLRPMLDDSGVDLVIGVRVGPYGPEYESQPFLRDRMAVFYDPAHRGPVETLEDYAEARHATLNFGGNQPSLLDRRFTELGLDRQIFLQATNIPLLADLIRGTPLITTMQARFFTGAFAGLAHCPPPVKLPRLQYDLVWHGRQSESRRHTWLRRAIFEAAGTAD
ncbi:LysR family transcriptional regulator [Poseidonocella sp. HB161398]|uniref:LysR family transcriptional regulator n=1 Tax=Poseidonocella sp. HB161398 TaxID=2320855 RepID=UPI00148672D7|nr:LysR family transcriptional regulator [Poseidonocella sp. HB161398]